jgi:cyclopropane-fatty-acyl-phospholipid synthase
MNRSLRQFLDRSIRTGRLETVDPQGESKVFGDGSGSPVRLRLATSRAEWGLVLNPQLRLGELIADGEVIIEEGSIYGLLELFFNNAATFHPTWPAVAHGVLRYLTRRLRQFNTPRSARHNIAHHYDLDGRLYSLFLDDDMQYSCAYFGEGVDTLEEAQLAKKRHLAAKLLLEPGQHVLDIGSGWGGLALFIAENFDVEVTGITLSEEQLKISNARAEQRGLASRVSFRLEDYRKVEGTFDRIVSVGMFEHVGLGNYRRFFDVCRYLLSPDGILLLHSIGRLGGPASTNVWIEKYIFPGGYIPALSEVAPAIEEARLILTDVEILRLHYARTLRAWRERFLASRNQVAAITDERFCRIWEYYLALSEIGFRYRDLMNFQLQLAKHNKAVPFTRDYVDRAEAAMRGEPSTVVPMNPDLRRPYS